VLAPKADGDPAPLPLQAGGSSSKALRAQEPLAEKPVKAVIIEDMGLEGFEGALAVVLVEVTETLDQPLSDGFRKGAKYVVSITAETKLERLTGPKREAARPADLKKGCQVEIRGIGLVHLSSPGKFAPRAVLIVGAP
jgi:hypothetical protein